MTTKSPTSKAAAILGKKGGATKSEAKTRAVKENGKSGGRPLHTLRLDVKVNIWDTEYVARIYRDKIIVSCPYTKWVNNSGSLASVKESIRDPKIIAAVLREIEDDAETSAWYKIGRSIGNEWLTEWADAHLTYGD
jgi:hypothetical protein